MMVGGTPPRLMMLVGPPGSGKSTWRDHMRPSDAIVVSTDDVVERWGAERGLNYTQAFRSIDFKVAEREAMTAFATGLAERRDIVVDRTNMTLKSRARFLAQVPRDYRKIAVVFDVPADELRARLAQRAAATGKTIPAAVVTDMLAKYEPPTADEFDEIVRV